MLKHPHDPEPQAYWDSITDHMRDLGQTEEEIGLLLEHDAGEELHAFVCGRRSETNTGSQCVECGDTAEGLMHNNTWRNVEPLLKGN